MGARQKLNHFYILGALGGAAVVGLLTQSWGLFLFTLICGVGGCLHDGSIRLGGSSRPPSKPRDSQVSHRRQ